MKKRSLAFVFMFALLLAPCYMGLVSAAVAATPGSTSTIMGMPVTQRITGLAASTTYVLDCETAASTEADQTLTSDSSGVVSATCVPTVYGSNLYNLTINTAAGASQVTWTVDNMDIIPYITPIIVMMVILMVIGAIKGGLVGGK